MKTSKAIKRMSEDLDMVISVHGVKYHVLTAKKFKNQRRHGPDEYFEIVAGEKIKDMRELTDEKS